MTDAVFAVDATDSDSPRGFPVRKFLVLTSVFFLPFTYALTLHLKFPVKVYEVALLLLALSYVFDLKVPVAPAVTRIAQPLGVLLVFALLVLLVRLIWPLPTFDVGAYHTRFGAAGDGLAKLLYFCLSVFGFGVFSYYALQYERQFIWLWVAGALAAATYTWYLFITSALGYQPLLLPGIVSAQHLGLGGLDVIRSGTFQEGNFLGLYLVLSVAIAQYARFKMPALLLSVTVLITFSTVNVIGLGILWLGVVLHRTRAQRSIGRRAFYVIGFIVLIAIVVSLLVTTGYLQQVVVGKLFTTEAGSKLDRLDQAVAGVRMFIAHPFAGVGISQYGYHYRAYQLTDIFDKMRVNKPIANNVYIEVLSELGVIGFLLFAAFLVQIYRSLRGTELTPLRWGFLAMLLVFNAFPTYTIMFIWAFFGLVAAIGARRRYPAAGDDVSLLPSVP